MTVEKVTDVLAKHGWPPATLVTLMVALAGIYFLYMDNQEMNRKWEDLASANLEVNTKALEQGRIRGNLLKSFIEIQRVHTQTLQKIETNREQEQIIDRQLTALAVQALQQVSDQLNVNLQQKTPQQVLNSEN